MTEALAIVDRTETALDRPHPREVIKAATEEANVLAEVIDSRKLYSVIQGRKFVRVEGWVTLATLRGCLPREVSVVEEAEGRYIATVELIRMSDGLVLTRASAECGGDGDNIWKGRPANARRSMAITRATGKACRVAFSWVMALAGFEVTPAEEMDHVGEQTSTRPPQTVQHDHPAPKIGPASATLESTWRGRLTGMSTKDGTTAGKAWRLFVFTGEGGEKFGTFSDTIAEGLSALDGHHIEIVYEAKKNGKNIVSFRDVTLEEAPFGH